MAQQFEHPLETDSQLRAQRMTADESRAVIDLWQQERVEQTGLTDKPAVPDVAEGLDITVEDVQRLLQEVRAKRLQEERALVLEQGKLRLAQEERKLAELHRQQTELRQERAYISEASPHSSRWEEVEPGVWEDAELVAIMANGPVAARFAKVLLRIVVLSFLLVAPFALLVYGIITDFNLR